MTDTTQPETLTAGPDATQTDAQRRAEWEAQRRAEWEAQNAEAWATPTPHRVEFQFTHEADLREFLGYMSDGGGEYGFVSRAAVGFHYHPPGHGFVGTGVVKVIRWGNDSELEGDDD